MNNNKHSLGLMLVNELAAEERTAFTFDEAQCLLARSRSATSNVLRRMVNAGFIERVRHGHYMLRPLGILGTPATAEDVALAVGAAFRGIPHRMGYRTALDEHDLLIHPARTIFVAAAKATRAKRLSGLSLRVIQEPKESLLIGSIKCGDSWVSDLERALLDAARRPGLVGGAEVLALAEALAASSVNPEKLMSHAIALNWPSAIRRLGSIADALNLKGLSGALKPICPIRADLDLEPGRSTAQPAWRDSVWHIRWPCTISEIEAVTQQ